MPMLNRPDDHHAFHEDAQPGDLTGGGHAVNMGLTVVSSYGAWR